MSMWLGPPESQNRITAFLSDLPVPPAVAASDDMPQRIGQRQPGQSRQAGLQEPAPRADANQIAPGGNMGLPAVLPKCDRACGESRFESAMNARLPGGGQFVTRRQANVERKYNGSTFADTSRPSCHKETNGALRWPPASPPGITQKRDQSQAEQRHGGRLRNLWNQDQLPRHVDELTDAAKIGGQHPTE